VKGLPVFLRIGRNKSLWEDGSIDELLRKAFSTNGGPDLRLSIYLVQPQELDQARAEHLVSLTGPPVSPGALDFDLTNLGPLDSTPGATLFAFTQRAHAEVRLDDEMALRELIAVLLREPERRLPRNAKAVLDYMVDHQHDVEWAAALKQRPKWAEIVRKKSPA
jgi:hypothetical protein